MTDAAIAEHIIYLVNKHTAYLDSIDKQYAYACDSHRTTLLLTTLAGSDIDISELPKKPIIPIEMNSLLLNRITATLENRSIDELSNP